jgi:hypothetical protein
MSFDIFLFTCNLGTGTKRIMSPFTGEPVTVPDDPGLTVEERAAVVSLLQELQAEGPDEFGCYHLSFADGGEAAVSVPFLVDESQLDGCSVTTRSLTADVISLWFRLSRAGNLVILPVAEGVGPLVTSEEHRERVAARYPDAKVVQSAEALGQDLRGGFESWRRYRAQLLGGEE